MHRHPIFSDLLALASTGSTIVAWQEQLDYWLRIAASIIAIIAGLAALTHRYKQRRAEIRSRGRD